MTRALIALSLLLTSCSDDLQEQDAFLLARQVGAACVWIPGPPEITGFYYVAPATWCSPTPTPSVTAGVR